MQHFGVVLAGGQSSRMGQDKAGLLWQQQTLLQYSQQLLEASLCKHILISRNLDISGQSPTIADRFKNRGPLGGIDAVLQELPERCLLSVLPVDMPLLDSATLTRLQTHSAKTQRSVCYSSSFLPCVLVVDNTLRRYIEQQLGNQGDYSIKRMLLFAKAERLAHLEPERLCNTNTPQQWHDAISTQQNHFTRPVR